MIENCTQENDIGEDNCRGGMRSLQGCQILFLAKLDHQYFLSDTSKVD